MMWTFVFCFAFMIKPSLLIDINVENKIIMEPLNSNITVTSGQKATLTCKFDITPEHFSSLSTQQLIWIRQSHRTYDGDLILGHNQDLLITDHRLNIQRTNIDYSLIITDVNIDDEGIYACEINTQPPQRSIIHLYVQEIPIIIDNATSSPIVVSEYDNITLDCQARGRPIPYIAWYWRNKYENNQTKMIENELLLNNTNGQLHLMNITRYQNGYYECRVSNGG